MEKIKDTGVLIHKQNSISTSFSHNEWMNHSLWSVKGFFDRKLIYVLTSVGKKKTQKNQTPNNSRENNFALGNITQRHFNSA